MKKSEILLINPPWYRLLGREFPFYPIGLCYLAGVLEQRGFDVWVYNSDYNYKKRGIGGSALKTTEAYDEYLSTLKNINHPLWKEVETMISQQSPDIVGISVMTGKYGSALNVSHLIKEFDQGIPVIWGGATSNDTA